jgi:hypothetical protein
MGIRILTGAIILVSVSQAPAPAQSPADAAACVLAGYNRHDVAFEARCFATSAISVDRRGERRPFDWEAEARYRRFDAVVHARFRHEPQPSAGDVVEVLLFETNDFLRALGIDEIRARWRYVTRGGLVRESHLLGEPTPAFAAALRSFSDWLRSRPSRDAAQVLDSTGSIVFDGKTAAPLVALARKWRGQNTSDPHRSRPRSL